MTNLVAGYWLLVTADVCHDSVVRLRAYILPTADEEQGGFWGQQLFCDLVFLSR